MPNETKATLDDALLMGQLKAGTYGSAFSFGVDAEPMSERRLVEGAYLDGWIERGKYEAEMSRFQAAGKAMFEFFWERDRDSVPQPWEQQPVETRTHWMGLALRAVEQEEAQNG